MASSDSTHPKSYAAAAATDPSELPQENATSAPHAEENQVPNGVNGTKSDQDGDSRNVTKETNGIAESPSRKGSKRSKAKGKPKEQRKDETDSTIKYEKHEDANGTQLVSIKPQEDYEKVQRQDELGPSKEQPKEEPEKGELVSGRQAGKGWDRSNIRWAPFNVPIKRRLQTLMVVLHSMCICLFFAFFFWLCAIPLLWPLLIPYLIYILLSSEHTDGTLRHRTEAFRRLPIWSLFASYFPARLHRTEELPPTRKYIFGYHPHGIIAHGAFAAFGTEALGFSQLFPGITNTLLTLDSNFRIPLYRDYALRLGLASVSRESCENLLSKGGPNGEGMGRAITIAVGGARESLDAIPGTLRLVLRCRKGFVKMAIRTGADLVPVLAFGENDLYDQIDADSHPRIHKFQLLLKKVAGFTLPLFHARGVFNYDVGLMPYRRPVNVVVGKPIMVMQQQNPPETYVDAIHGQYMQELQRMWEAWKEEFAGARREELTFVD